MSWIAHSYTTRLSEPSDEEAAHPSAVQKIWDGEALDACRSAQDILAEAEQAREAILAQARAEGERQVAVAVAQAEQAVWERAKSLLNGLDEMRAAFHASVEDEVVSLLVRAFERLSDELPPHARLRTVLRELLSQGEGAKFARLRVPAGFEKTAQQLSQEFGWVTRLSDDFVVEVDKRLTDSVILDTHRFTVQASMQFARDTVLNALRSRPLETAEATVSAETDDPSVDDEALLDAESSEIDDWSAESTTNVRSADDSASDLS